MIRSSSCPPWQPDPTSDQTEDRRSYTTPWDVTFEFDDSKQTEVFADLERREGKNFPLRKMRIKLGDGRNVEAYLPVYVGKNVITGKTLDELVAMAMAAVGKDGKASDYVFNIAKKLNAAGVEDCTVNAFAAAVRKAQRSDG